MSLDTLKHQYRMLATKAHDLVTDETLTDAEKREQYEKMAPDLKSMSEQITNAEFLDEQRKSLSGIIGDPGATAETEDEPKQETVKSLGEQFTASAVFKDVVGRIKSGTLGTFQSPGVELKATLSESGLTGSNFIAQDRQPGILPILFQRLTVADLMPSGSTNSNTVRYAKEGTATNAASTVAEGGTKPEATLNFTVVDEPVRKIAVTIKVTDEMLEDVAQMESYINGRLQLFVRIREEQQLLTGNGTSPDLTGILNRANLTAATPKGSETYGPIAIAAHKALTAVRVASFLDPDAFVFHPNDWQQARFEADANGQFFGGGPYTGAYGNNGIPGDTYWGLRVVSTTAMTENTILLGAFQTAAQVFRRTGLTVEMTNSNEDDFKNNLVAIRAEERLALAVYRPAAFTTVTGV